MSSLRARLFAYLALAAVVSSGLTVAVAFVLTDRSEQRQRQENLRRQTDAVATTLELSGVRRVPRLRLFLVRGGRVLEPLARRGPGGARQRLARRLRAVAERATAAEGATTVGGREFTFVRRDTAAGPIAVARSRAAQAGEVRPIGRILLLTGLGGALVAAGLAALFSRRLTRPLRELIAATRPLAVGDASVRVAVRGGDELAELGRAFNCMADELAAARDAERRFLMNVSHELKTPLTSVRGYAEALEDGAVAGPVAARTIAAEAARLERLVGDLLDLARLGTREFTVARARVDLGEVAAAARGIHLEQARVREVTLDMTATEEAVALGDRDRLVQAVSNLVDNAIRVTPPGGSVEITAEPGRLSVRDTGPGLADKDILRAFERFHLHRRHHVPGDRGSGLGLAIVKELVEAMGGRVEARSAAGTGAEFALHLPSAGEWAVTAR